MNPEEVFESAVTFALTAHRVHKRKKNNTPYVAHLLGTASEAMKWAWVFNQCPYLLGTVAILHDTVEDVNVSIDTIKELFGSVVADAVESLSEDKDLDKEARKEGYISSVANGPTISQIVSFFDKWDNAKDYSRGWGKFTKATYDFYMKLMPIYRAIPGMPDELVDDLADSIGAILWVAE